MTRKTGAWVAALLILFGLHAATCVPTDRAGKDLTGKADGVTGGTAAPATAASAPATAISATAASLGFNQYFEYQPLDITPRSPQYSLPLEAGEIANLEAAAGALELSPKARARLLEQGFVVTDLKMIPDCEDIVGAYKAIGASGCPVLVTSGSLLHVYHILFDNTLSTIEAKHLYDNLWTVASGLFARCAELDRDSSPEVREAATRCAAYLAVGLSLLKPQDNQVPQPAGPRGGPRMGGPALAGVCGQ
jgi:hypothetical protein